MVSMPFARFQLEVTRLPSDLLSEPLTISRPLSYCGDVDSTQFGYPAAASPFAS
jgi:hypothetical protein